MRSNLTLGLIIQHILAIIELTDKLLRLWNERRHKKRDICLDLSKAFDSLNHDILLDKMKYYGFRRITLQLFKSDVEMSKSFQGPFEPFTSNIKYLCPRQISIFISRLYYRE